MPSGHDAGPLRDVRGPLVLALPNKAGPRACGWPRKSASRRAVAMQRTIPLRDALEHDCAHDTHLALYRIEDLTDAARATLDAFPPRGTPRLNKDAAALLEAAGARVVLGALMIDVDLGESHSKSWADLDVTPREYVAPYLSILSPAAWYSTPGGFRIVHILDDVGPGEFESIARRVLREYDRALPADARRPDELTAWNHLYRAPRAVRDGVKLAEEPWFDYQWLSDAPLDLVTLPSEQAPARHDGGGIPIAIPFPSAADEERDLIVARNCLAILRDWKNSPRDRWLRVGMAAHSAGVTMGEFIEWSRHGNGFAVGEVEKAWLSFSARGGIGLGSLIQWAREEGASDSAIFDGVDDLERARLRDDVARQLKATDPSFAGDDNANDGDAIVPAANAFDAEADAEAARAHTATRVLANAVKHRRRRGFILVERDPFDMLADMRAMMGAEPKSVAGALAFLQRRRAPDELAESSDVGFIVKADELAPALATRNIRTFFASGDAVSAVGCDVSLMTRAEFVNFAAAAMPAEDCFDSVEVLPHHPRVADAWYIGAAANDLAHVTRDGSAFAELIDHLNPASEIDRELLAALFRTPAWGGPPGARPLFVITAEESRGSGKTSTAELLASLYGGAVRAHNAESDERFVQRLLALDSISTRLILADECVAWKSRDRTALVTAERIAGHRMYHGEASRSNMMTWLVTAPSVDGSADFAARAVVIKLGPKREDDAGAFAEWSKAFVRDRRAEFLADVIDSLRDGERTAVAPKWLARFGAWTRDVVGLSPVANAVAEEIQERRRSVDSDATTADAIVASLTRLATRALRYARPDAPTPAVWSVRLTSAAIVEALRLDGVDLLGRRPTRANVTKLLRRAVEQSDRGHELRRRIEPSATNAGARGWVIRSAANVSSRPTAIDLPDNDDPFWRAWQNDFAVADDDAGLPI